MSEQTFDGTETMHPRRKVILTSSAERPKLYNADPTNPPEILIPRSGGRPPSKGTVTQVVDLGDHSLAGVSFIDEESGKEKCKSVDLDLLQRTNPDVLILCLQEEPKPGIVQRIGHLMQKFRDALDRKLS